MRQDIWAANDVIYLMNNIEKLGYIKIANKLNRTPIAVKEKAKVLRKQYKEWRNIKIYQYGLDNIDIKEIDEIRKLAFSKPWV